MVISHNGYDTHLMERESNKPFKQLIPICFKTSIESNRESIESHINNKRSNSEDTLGSFTFQHIEFKKHTLYDEMLQSEKAAEETNSILNENQSIKNIDKC